MHDIHGRVGLISQAHTAKSQEMRSDEQREQRDLPRHRPSSDSRMRKAILNPRTTGGQKFERPGSGSSRRITTVPKRDDSMSSDEMDYGPTMVPRAKTVTDGRWFVDISSPC